MAGPGIHQFPCLSDNYGVLMHDPHGKVTAAIDTPDAAPVRAALREKGWTLTHIFTTHHHQDHVAGHKELKAETGCTILGAAKDAHRIPGIDIKLNEGGAFQFGRHEVRVIETPGHTSGHISFWLPEAEIAFVGDTLFSLGCGRLLECGPEVMWSSLQKLMKLPPQTLLYCGHEYTLGNAKFALTIEPENEALQRRAEEVRRLRAESKPAVPSRMADELAANPFLRPSSPAIQQRLGLTGAPLAAIFAEIRRRKDVF